MLPDSRARLFDEQLQAVDQQSGQPLAGLPYRVELPDGVVLRGTTDEAGRTQRIAAADPAMVKVVWGDLAGPDTALANEINEEC